MESEDYLDLYFENGFMFFVPSRLMWSELGENIKESDHFVICNKEDSRLEKFIFRKV